MNTSHWTTEDKCLECGGPVVSRSLCRKCYVKHRMSGTLGQFPTKYRVKRTPIPIGSLALKTGRGCPFAPTEAQLDSARDLAKMGYSREQIAAHWGVSCATARKWLQSHGIKNHSGRRSPDAELRDRLHALLASGVRPAAAARLIGVTRQRVNQILSPDKHSARMCLRRAVDESEVLVSPRCWDCGTVGPVQGHHDDYSRPLAVAWLCHKCHVKRDRLGDARR